VTAEVGLNRVVLPMGCNFGDIDAAVGAKIRVDLRGTAGAVASRYRTITAGSSFGGNPLACTIGLGRAAAIQTLEVSWTTSGTRRSFHDLPADRAIKITEGQPDFRVLDAPPIKSP
jgi:ASPIC and UnbV